MRKKEISCKRENTRDIIGDRVQEWGSRGRRVRHGCPAVQDPTSGEQVGVGCILKVCTPSHFGMVVI